LPTVRVYHEILGDRFFTGSSQLIDIHSIFFGHELGTKAAKPLASNARSPEMTQRSIALAQAPLFGTIAILVASLTLLAATGPAIAAERSRSTVVGSSLNPPVDRLGDHAS
jgi:hypothetical protein